ncbi:MULTISPECIES: non-ribosomal peptide synthetase [Methylosinus]|uniref:non-ribosomal peptide synthetase n=1 Tax=Methylosinus TaxID=425 RepID=UPI0002E94BAC|nr:MULTISPECIES: non-ribosomal peptide synthetase [Methylosinus]
MRPDSDNLVNLLRMRAADQSTKLAYLFLDDGEREGARTSFADLDLRARAIAARLASAGAKGARALLLYPPGLPYIEAFFGCLYAGVVAVPAYPPSGRHFDRLRSIVLDSQPSIILTTEAMRLRFETSEDIPTTAAGWIATDQIDVAASADWRPYAPTAGDLAFLQYTSGSTAEPRGVMISHGNLMSNQALIAESFGHGPDSDLVGWLPLYHDMGLIGNILQPMYVGATAYLMSPMAFLEKPARWLQAISRYGARTSGGPNFAYDLCVRKMKEEDKRDLDLSEWRVAFSGAEPVRAKTLDGFARAFADCGFRRDAFTACYGLAEATLVVTAPTGERPIPIIEIDRAALDAGRMLRAATGRSLSFVGCGHAWPGYEVAIVDPERSTRCGPAAVGEIWVAGPGVARGYWERPEDSARVFGARIAGEDRGPYLRTGDLGFFEDGELFIAGRLKDMIIVAGRNIHAQDVEAAIEQRVADLRPGAVAALSLTQADEERLVVIAEPDRAAAAASESAHADILTLIRRCVAEDLGVEPAHVVLARPGSIPKTSSGKLRRSECRRLLLADELTVIAQWSRARPEAEATLKRHEAAPRPSAFLRQAMSYVDAEQRAALLRRFLSTSAAEILDMSEREVSDAASFVDVGLSSLRAVELKHRIDAALDIDAPIELLLSNVSMATAADAMLRIVDGSTPPSLGAAPHERRDSALSFTQRSMWTIHRLEGAGEAYNLHLAIGFEAPIDVERLQRAIHCLVERHEQLRTVFRPCAGEDMAERVALNDAPLVLRVEKAAHWSDAELRDAMSKEARRSFDIENEPPLRVVLYRVTEDRHALLFVAHHIAVDQWSLVLLLDELDRCYRGEAQTAAEPRYGAFVAAEADYLASAAAERDWTYWREQLAGPLPVLDLPQDFRRAGRRDYRGGSTLLMIDDSATRRLKDLARREGVSLYSALLTVYFALLRRSCGQDDIIVGGAASGRLDHAAAATVGNCVNPIAIRSKIAPQDRFIDLLRRVNEQVKGAIVHQRFPFQLVVERLNPVRVDDQWPIYQTWFVLQQAQGGAPSAAAALSLGEELGAIDLLGVAAKPVALSNRVEMFDLKVMAAEHEGRLALSFQFSEQVLSRSSVAAMADRYARLLDALLRSPDCRIGDAHMLDEAERRTILVRSTGDELSAPRETLLHDLIGADARSDDIAVVAEDGSLTYGELRLRANQIARLLQRAGIGPETPVGVLLDPGLDYVASVLGVLVAGGAFVPLDPAYPSERLRYMLADSGARALISAQSLPRLDCVIPKILVDADELADVSNDAVVSSAHPDNLAYIVYTSGSTGGAKGVMATHRNAVASLLARFAFYPQTVDDFLLLSSLSFDSSFAGLFWTLARGGRLHLVAETTRRDPVALKEIIASRDITHFLCLPSFHRELLGELSRGERTMLKCCIVAGEACGADVVERHFHTLPEAALINEYGPTECSVWCAAEQLSTEDDLSSGVSIGRAIPGSRAYVLDENGELAPVGIAGELCVGGAGVARGYRGGAELTATKFTPDPFGFGERLYRTGDRARYRADGKLEFMGRSDQQVKIRGHRIEISEVEDVLSRLPGVREAAVVARADATGDKRLVAYVVGELEPRAVKEAFRSEAPHYMTPHFVVALQRLPRLDNGKVDRKALPAPDVDALLSERYVAPTTETEAAICAVFAETLGLARVGADDDFFDLGGDSIRAIQAASALRLRGYEAAPRDFFQYPTAASLAPRLRVAKDGTEPTRERRSTPFSLAQLGATDVERLKAVHGDAQDIYPLTPMQEGMLFHALSQQGTGLYLMQDRYEIKGALDIDAFLEAWRRVIDRHDILRTSFDWSSEGRPHQIVHRAAALPFEVTDLSGATEQEQTNAIDRALAAEREAGFDLAQAPLMRIRIFRLADDRHICVRSFHHIILDDWCTSLLILDVRRHYAAVRKGEATEFAPAPQFWRYIEWIAEQSERTAEQFWRAHLDGFVEPTPLVGAKPSTRDAVSFVEDIVVDLSNEMYERLRALVQQRRLTLNTFVQGALALTLGRAGGVDDVVFGVTASGRPIDLDGADATLGLFINSLPLRVRIDRRKPVIDWLREILADNLEMRQYEFVPQTNIQRWSAISRSDAPLFQHLLTFENAPLDPSVRGEKDVLDIDLLQLRVHTNYPLTFVAIPGETLGLRLTYDRERFDAETVQRIAEAFRRSLEQLIVNCDSRLCELALLSPAEVEELTVAWNATDRDHGEPLDLVARFEAQAATAPNRIAAACGDGSIRYGELNARANRLAHALIQCGVGPDVVVALLDDRGVDFLVAILAIFKAGGAYLPLDPAHPDGRIAQVLAESEVALLAAGAALRNRAHDIAATLGDDQPRLLDLATLEASESRTDNPPRRHAPDNLAFVIFTSGSTGKPKGAMVEHRGMFNNLVTKIPALALTENDVIAQTASQCFDISVWQFLTALTIGARVEIFPDAVSRDPQRLAADIARGVTILEAVPSMIRALLELADSDASIDGLRWLLPCGEAFAPELCRRFMERYPQVRLLNAYGPAECSDDVTYHPIIEPPIGDELSVPIGRPVDNTKIYLLDRWLDPAPIGVDAEICVAGVQVGRGYLGRADLTAASFAPDPFGPPGSRLYRTGDLGRYRADGVIEFLGRVDHQVKIRGHRIEPGEVEACLSAHVDVCAAAVVAREASRGVYRLVAYVVGRDREPEPEELRAYLRQSLPDYMIPSAFVNLGALPLTRNGKVDRKALPEPDIAAQLADKFVAPRNDAERALAKIWADVLRVDAVGVHDNFFELGGDSILSIQIVSRARRAGLTLMPKQIFDLPTVAQLAEAARAQSAIVEEGVVAGEAPLTPIQHWFFEQELDEPHHWNLAVLLELRDEMTPADFETATRRLVEHHDALRMRFTQRERGWSAFVAPSEEGDVFHVEDLSSVPAEAHEETIAARATQWQRRFDLAAGPLFRIVWFDLGASAKPRILLAAHHLVVDGVSLRILLEDMESACRQAKSGRAITLPAKTTSYRTWARRLSQTAIPPGDIDYWSALDEIEAQPLHVENPRGSRRRRHGAEARVALDAETTRALLQDAPAAYHTRINELLLASFARAVCAWTGSNVVTIDLEGHGREDVIAGVDVSRTVGWFTSIYPVRLQDVLESDPEQLIKSVKEQLRRIPTNGFYHGVRRYLRDEGGARGDILFNYLGRLDQALSPDSPFAPATGASGENLSLEGSFSHEWEIVGDVTDGCLRLCWRFSAERYSRSTIEALAAEWKRELEGLVRHCLDVETSSFTPSDFPLSTLGQADLDRLITDPANVEDIYPAAPMQQGLLLHTLLDPHSGIYLMQDVIELKADLDVDAFRHAWRQVVDSHSMLRTAFYWTTDERPHQIALKSVPMPCELFDWRDLEEEERGLQLQTMLHDELTSGLTLDRAPILRMRLIRTGPDRWTYIRSHHHIMLDAWCLPLLLADFLRYYEAALRGAPAPTRVATPYRAYIAWLQRQDLDAAQSYWREALAGFRTPTFLAAKRPRRSLAPGEVEVTDAQAELSKEDTTALHEACRRHRLTTSAFLQGAWALLMVHYLNRSEIVFGVTVAGRPGELDRVEDMAGLFINTLPCRVTVEPSARIADWLRRLLSQTAEMRQYEYAPLTDIQKWSEIERGEQLFDSFVVYENVPVNESLRRSELPLEVLSYSSRTHSNYPLNLSVMPNERLHLRLTYNQTLLDAESADRMVDHYRRLLEGMIRTPDSRVCELALLSPAEVEELTVAWNATDRDHGEPLDLVARFEAQAATAPNRIAVACGDVSIRYGELNMRANKLAHALSRCGVGPDVVVALLDDRGVDFLVAILAIFKAGGAYLPLDPAHPDGRIAQVLAESEVALLAAGAALRNRARDIAATLGDDQPRLLDLATLEASESRTDNPPRRQAPDNLAFVIFTSGSTGKPKGAMVEHRGMFNNLVTKIPALGLTENDVIAQTASQCFDISVWQFLTALTIGARVEIFPDAVSRDPQRLAAEIARGVTILEAVPSMIRALLELADSDASIDGLRWLLPCGEAFAPELCRRFMERYPQVRLLNAYGPAECSDDVTYHPIIEPPMGDELSVPIGRPVDNTKIYLLDRWLDPAPIGVDAEICVAGVQVGRGYLGRADLTAASFAPDPFGPPGSRLYRTGDLGRYRADGVIEFLGRVDHQVKIRGHRIEPGEVEACLSAHVDVCAAAVVAREASRGVYRLVAYVVGRDREPEPEELRAYLRQSLPDYMIPSAFVNLGALPLTRNGKVDRKALPEPDIAAQLADKFVAPRNDAERALAKIWADVLRVDAVGVRDNFFELGGHSLLMTQIASRIQMAFDIQIPLRSLFEARTVAEMAEVVNAGLSARAGREIASPANGDYEVIDL